MSSWPMPILAWTEVNRTAPIVPTSQAAPAVAMNRPTLVPAAGTPTERAAGALPPTAKIQLPIFVRTRIQVATAAITIHHRIATRNCTPNSENVPASSGFTTSYPGALASPDTCTVPVIALVTPRLRPCSIRNVLSVTMKLGSPVLTTMTPLNAPINSATTRLAKIAAQMFQPYSVARIMTTSPVVAVITPAERSNSPPIMSSAMATAMMPSVEAGSSQIATPSRERNTLDWVAKNTNTTIAPTTEPSSGRTRIRRTRLISATRSSTGGAAVDI